MGAGTYTAMLTMRIPHLDVLLYRLGSAFFVSLAIIENRGRGDVSLTQLKNKIFRGGAWPRADLFW